MPNIIIAPVLDDMLCRQIYIRLLTIEARKFLEQKRSEFWDGYQNGYVCFVNDLFGESSDDEYFLMAQTNNSYLDILEDLMDDSNFKKSLQNIGFSLGDHMATLDLDILDEAVENVIDDFFNKNPKRMIESIKVM